MKDSRHAGAAACDLTSVGLKRLSCRKKKKKTPTSCRLSLVWDSIVLWFFSRSKNIYTENLAEGHDQGGDDQLTADGGAQRGGAS